jgi:hypothetical protein
MIRESELGPSKSLEAVDSSNPVPILENVPMRTFELT